PLAPPDPCPRRLIATYRPLRPSTCPEAPPRPHRYQPAHPPRQAPRSQPAHPAPARTPTRPHRTTSCGTNRPPVERSDLEWNDPAVCGPFMSWCGTKAPGNPLEWNEHAPFRSTSGWLACRSADRVDPAVGEGVRALVALVARVTAHPHPVHVVAGHLGVELAPQVLVLDRCLGGGAPAVALPPRDPLRDPVHDVLRVDVQVHPARGVEGAQRLDHRTQLHAVVGRHCLAAEQLLLVAVRAQQRPPAARTGIALARSVGPDLHHGLVSHDAHLRGSTRTRPHGLRSWRE